MGRNFVFCICCILLSRFGVAAPAVSNVQASQRSDGSGLVDVYYTLSGGQGAMKVGVVFSNDNGVTWNIAPSADSLSGDIGSGITNGSNRHIIWDAGQDRPGIRWTQCRAKVTASDSSGPEEITITLPGGITMDMVRIPAGSFLMGRYPGEQDSYSDEDPQHQVTISQDFYLGKYELTKAQWTAVMGTTPWSGQSDVLNDPNSPAVYVSWNAAQSFITALNQLGQGTFRLPSEAEWEYACRAGTTTRFYWGDDPSYTQIGDYAWDRSNCSGERYAHIVGLKLPNAFGLYDMSGNVWELCQDYWHDNYTGAPANGNAWESPTSSSRVRRGGSWIYDALDCRSAYRYSGSPNGRSCNVGLRLVRTQ